MDDSTQKHLRNRKPFRILSKLSKDEIQQFRHFLESTLVYPKADQKLIAFFDHCHRILVWNSDHDKPRFEKDSGWVLTDNAFDKLVSKLYNALTTYAGLVSFLEAEEQHGQYALKFYEKKGFRQEEIAKKVKEGKRELSNAVQDDRYFRNLLALEIESVEKANSRTQTPEERGLSNLHGHLDNYFFILKLRFLCASVNEQRIFGETGAEVVDAPLLQWMQSRYDSMPELAQIYFHAFHILNGSDDEKHLHKMQTMLNNWDPNSSLTLKKEFAELNGYLLNFYLRKLNQGDLNAVVQAHHYYLEALQNGWVLEEGKISPEHFKNIIVLYCRQQLLQEATAFFERYKTLLSDTQGGVAWEYNEAVLLFYAQKYDVLIPKLEMLLDAKGTLKADQYYGLDLRCFLLKAYYEYLAFTDLKRWDEIDEKLQNLLHAFPAYVARKNLPRLTQVRFDNFRKALQRLYAITYVLPESEKKSKMKELLTEFKSSSNLMDKGWCIQKAVALTQAE